MTEVLQPLSCDPSESYSVHCLKAWRAKIDIVFVWDVFAFASHITSCVAKNSRGMSALLRTACIEVKLGQRNFRQQLRHLGSKFVFHFLLLFSFQPPFQASPSFLNTARERFFNAFAVLVDERRDGIAYWPWFSICL
jgi:hypothetical protein